MRKPELAIPTALLAFQLCIGSVSGSVPTLQYDPTTGEVSFCHLDDIRLIDVWSSGHHLIARPDMNAAELGSTAPTRQTSRHYGWIFDPTFTTDFASAGAIAEPAIADWQSDLSFWYAQGLFPPSNSQGAVGTCIPEPGAVLLATACCVGLLLCRFFNLLTRLE